MSEWKQYVREHLPPLNVSAAREREILEELAQQLEQEYTAALRSGDSAREAEQRAKTQFADWKKLARDIQHAEQPIGAEVSRRMPETWKPTVAEARLRQRRGGMMIADFLQDLRYALRMLRKSPGFAAVMVLTLALGIGANTTIFSIIRGVLLRPLPYGEPDRLMMLYENNPKRTCPQCSVSAANFMDWREQNHSFDRIAAMDGGWYSFVAGGVPRRELGLTVTDGFFDALGVRAAVGRMFVSDDFQPGHDNVAILNYGFWQSSFGGDRSIVGRTIDLDGKPHTIIGVLPRGFQFLDSKASIWAPRIYTQEEKTSRGGHWLTVIGQRKRGATAEQANADIATIAARLSDQYPKTNRGWSASAVPMQQDAVGEVRPALLVLFAAVGFVLLIACVNAANMLLARATVRRREIAIRTALGASRARIVLQMLAESVLIAMAGAAAGLAIAYGAIRIVRTLPADYLPMAGTIIVDGEVLAFTLGIGAATGLLFGLVPALISSRTDVQKALNESGRSATGAAGGRLRMGLAVLEVAISLIVLVGAGLLLRSFARLSSVEPGFQTEDRTSFMLNLASSRYPNQASMANFYAEIERRMKALPGVEDAAITSLLPLSGDGESYSVNLANVPEDTSSPSAIYATVTPDYFRTMGIPLLAGRVFTERDSQGTPAVCVINEGLARSLFPNGNAIGQRIQFGRRHAIVREIVGVVDTVKEFRLAEKPRPEAYEAVAQLPESDVRVVLKSSGNAATLIRVAEEQIHAVDAQLPVSEVQSLDEVMSESVALPRFRTVLLGIFAGLAILLAAIGLYGVLSYAVTQRTQEFGIRMALGAQRRRIYRMVIGKGMLLVGVGIGVGLAGALGLTRFLESFLFGVTRYDPWTMLGVVGIFGSVALAACFLPARRATRVDPLAALRWE